MDNFERSMRNWFDRTGMAKKATAYLRSEMALHVQQTSCANLYETHNKNDNADDSSSNAALISLIADFLSQRGFLFSLSVFCGEAPFPPTKEKYFTSIKLQYSEKKLRKFTRDDALQLLKNLALEDSSILDSYQKTNSEKSLLDYVIQAIPEIIKEKCILKEKLAAMLCQNQVLKKSCSMQKSKLIQLNASLKAAKMALSTEKELTEVKQSIKKTAVQLNGDKLKIFKKASLLREKEIALERRESEFKDMIASRMVDIERQLEDIRDEKKNVEFLRKKYMAEVSILESEKKTLLGKMGNECEDNEKWPNEFFKLRKEIRDKGLTDVHKDVGVQCVMRDETKSIPQDVQKVGDYAMADELSERIWELTRRMDEMALKMIPEPDKRNLHFPGMGLCKSPPKISKGNSASFSASASSSKETSTEDEIVSEAWKKLELLEEESKMVRENFVRLVDCPRFEIFRFKFPETVVLAGTGAKTNFHTGIMETKAMEVNSDVAVEGKPKGTAEPVDKNGSAPLYTDFPEKSENNGRIEDGVRKNLTDDWSGKSGSRNISAPSTDSSKNSSDFWK